MDLCVILGRNYQNDIKMWLFCDIILDIFAVVPLAGTWIEILLKKRNMQSTIVVPLAGTWIEI